VFQATLGSHLLIQNNLNFYHTGKKFASAKTTFLPNYNVIYFFSQTLQPIDLCAILQSPEAEQRARNFGGHLFTGKWPLSVRDCGQSKQSHCGQFTQCTAKEISDRPSGMNYGLLLLSLCASYLKNHQHQLSSMIYWHKMI
jgi:hypothetical protein